MRTRNGFIFLYILALLSITLTLAFALLSTARAAHTGATGIEMDLLANRAAKHGVQHALSVIRQDFLNDPGMPTRLDGLWRTHFWPIDATKVGFETAALGDNKPIGSAYTVEDFYENDVSIENLLTEPYLEVNTATGIYSNRRQRYLSGWYNHPGVARWYEPGVQSLDPVAKPLSFHVTHPAPSDAGSADPARRAGENYLPDLNEPIWYDSALVATDDPAQRRYRLRYAVCIEDLGGHLLCSVPGEFDETITSVFTGSPSDADRHKITEVDSVVADRYGGAISNMFRYSGGRGWEWGDLALRGLGGTEQYIHIGMGSSRSQVLASRDGSGRLTYYLDDPNGGRYSDSGGYQNNPYYSPVAGTDFRMKSERVKTETDVPVFYFSVGPVPSFQALWYRGHDDPVNERPFLFTPFGRAPQRVVTPRAWFESRVDAPWRLNLPTAVPQAVTAMIYAYLPDEFRAMKAYPKNSTTLRSDPIIDPAVQLLTEMGGEAAFERNGDVVPDDPYPGTDVGAPGGHWLPDLGAGVLTNSALGVAGMGNLDSDATYPGFPFTRDGADSSGAVYHTRKWNPGSGTFTSYADNYTSGAVFFYPDSYWIDCTVAMIHAVAVARFSWLDQINGAYAGDPQSGKPRWPVGIPAGYFAPVDAPGFTPGNLMRDHDANGDGQPDVPSAFDTIAELDHQFLRNLGEWPGDHPTGTRPLQPHAALRSVPVGNEYSVPTVAVVDLQSAGSKNIKMLRTAALITPQRAALMELVVNDMRMSFFGASPNYGDFRPLDLDDDGVVRSSAYASGRADADPATGRGPEPEIWFSLTGCFTIEKSRYYRIFTRGQLFDELRGVPVSETNLETVYVVDPDGDMADIDGMPAGVPTTGLSDSHILFQRRLNNRYLGTGSHVDR